MSQQNTRSTRLRVPSRSGDDDDQPLAPHVAAAFRTVFDRARVLISTLAEPREPAVVRHAARSYVEAASTAGVSSARIDDALSFLLEEHSRGQWTAARLRGLRA
jgi:hypothetical protein